MIAVFARQERVGRVEGLEARLAGQQNDGSNLCWRMVQASVHTDNSAVILVGVTHHEPWADEPQAGFISYQFLGWRPALS